MSIPEFFVEFVTGDSISSRKRIAREAANLLCYGAEKEYEQVKLKTAKSSRLHPMPIKMEPFLVFRILSARSARACAICFSIIMRILSPTCSAELLRYSYKFLAFFAIIH